ncbi:MAG: hypothetical protein H7Y06_00465, partial [Opitutaceae bacterium]|nr:hypothetical protein [Opitutaceae bacterium]
MSSTHPLNSFGYLRFLSAFLGSLLLVLAAGCERPDGPVMSIQKAATLPAPVAFAVSPAPAVTPVPPAVSPEVDRVVALPNADFEGDEVRWDFSAARGTAQVSPEAAFS